ncbi:acyl-CoA thioesterase [Streptomyces sp. NPDC096339]|uniref:acyl-CoA thioesterase n=1 Tax=Streptomyces sp. NPDC096339 TaxID=3366086 RepID=UPI0038121931
MPQPFSVRIGVREYELDTRGHLNQAVYLQYCEHALWEVLRAAGVPGDKLLASGVGPAQLECTLKFKRELQGGEEVDVSCVFTWGEGKTFRLRQDIRKADGTLAAEVTGVLGLLDLSGRSLIPDPGGHLRTLAEHPAVLGL